MISEILKSLTPEQREQLMVAFELEVTQVIEYAAGCFIGVHVPDTFTIVKQSNGWAIGEL